MKYFGWNLKDSKIVNENEGGFVTPFLPNLAGKSSQKTSESTMIKIMKNEADHLVFMHSFLIMFPKDDERNRMKLIDEDDEIIDVRPMMGDEGFGRSEGFPIG